MPWRLAVPVPVLLAPLAADAEIAGKAKMIDGDTIEIDGKQIHLYGIDAPEIGQTRWFQRRDSPAPSRRASRSGLMSRTRS